MIVIDLLNIVHQQLNQMTNMSHLAHHLELLEQVD